MAALPANVQPSAERIAARFHLDPAGWFRGEDTLSSLQPVARAVGSGQFLPHRYRTLATMKVETEVDIFTTGISVDPTFGEFEEELRQADEAKRAASLELPHRGSLEKMAPVELVARVTIGNKADEILLALVPGGKRLSVGRVKDNELALNDASVSKIHAALLMNQQGTLLVADTGSTNGTFINGRRISYGEARQIEDGDVVGFGDVEVRFRKNE